MPDSANSKPALNTHAEGEHPPHSLPGSTAPATQGADKASTASHPHDSKPDPTTGGEKGILHPSDGKAPGATREELLSENKQKNSTQDAERGLSTASTAGASQQPSSETPQLPALVKTLRSNLRQYPDFPQPGILFEDILPLFASPKLFETLLTALELLITSHLGKDSRIDSI
ncbi:adenine phosphoribosyltransferase, partial [Oleoguttula sp. CCFEE 5521]